MGLLDGFFADSQDDPRYERNMSLFSGIAKGDVSGELMRGQERMAQKKLQDMKMEELQLALQKAKADQAREEGRNNLMPQFLSQGGPAQGGTAGVNAALPPELQIGAQSPIQARGPGFDVRGYTQAAMQNKLMNPLEALEMQKKFAPESQINKLDAKDFDPASVARFQQTGNYADLKRMDKLHFTENSGNTYGLDPFSGQQRSKLQGSGNPFKDDVLRNEDGAIVPNSPLIGAKSQIARAGASNMTMVNKQEGEESKAVGKFFGENFADVQKAGFSAQNSMNRYDRLGQLLDGVDTGKFAPLGVEVAKASQAFGVNIDPKLSNKEAAVALSSEIALQLRNPSGGAGMPGAMSDADRNFLTGMVPGIEKTPEGRKLILGTAKKLAQRDIDVAKMARDYRQKNKTINEGFYDELSRFSAANPLFVGAQASGGTPRGQVFDTKPPANASNKGKLLTAPDGVTQYRSNGLSWVEVK